MQQRKISPRVTLTKTYPLDDYERRQNTPGQKEPSFAEKEKQMRDKVILRHLQQRYEEALNGKKDNTATLNYSTNDSLIHS